MYYSLTAEQWALSGAVRGLLDKHAEARVDYPDPGLGVTVEGPSEAKLWSQLGDMGLAALLVPEERGGSGAGPVELVLVAEELGRAVAAAPFLGTSAVTAALLVEGVDMSIAIELLERIAGGAQAALVTDAAAVQAQEAAAGWLLNGSSALVIDAVVGGDLLVGAITPDGPALFHTTGAEVVPQLLVDHRRRVGMVRFDGTPARLLAAGTAAKAALARGRAVACLVLAADSTGVAAAVLDRTSEYARVRRQFGLPIGTFQAVKHRLADTLVLAENCRSATWGGAWALTEDWSSAEMMVAMAKARATSNAVTVAGSGIQLHGGIAITWEHDMHLFLRRAKANEHLLGEPAEHLEAIAAVLLRHPA